MKFYSYYYVSNQIKSENIWFIVMFVILLCSLIYFSIKAYKNKRDTKYREPVIILGLIIVVVALIGFGNYQVKRNSTNRYRESLHFIEFASQKLGVDKTEVYVNTSASTDGAIIKVGDSFYRAIAGNDSERYLLEKIDLYHPNIELVEGKQ